MFRAGTRERSLWFELSDTGVEIPSDLDVFQPFATSKPGGMGLGLAITRHIVETHGGTMSYKSQPSKGTTLYLSLPQMIETKSDSAQREPAEDDDPVTASGVSLGIILSEVLSRLGHGLLNLPPYGQDPHAQLAR